jgi:hypothetical protein
MIKNLKKKIQLKIYIYIVLGSKIAIDMKHVGCIGTTGTHFKLSNYKNDNKVEINRKTLLFYKRLIDRWLVTVPGNAVRKFKKKLYFR